MTLNLLFFGTEETGAPFLQYLLEGRHHVAGVVVPARKPGREDIPHALWKTLRQTFQQHYSPRSTREIAQRNSLPLWDRPLAEEGFTSFCARLHPDLFVVASFSNILHPETLALAPLGVINLHPSLLPKYRGADPVFWAIANGETVTGVTVHWMDEGVDTGSILLQREVRVDENADSLGLARELTRAGCEALAEALDQIDSGQAARIVQNEAQATYFPPAKPAYRVLHWDEPAESILRRVRACAIFGGALAEVEHHPVRVLKAEVCGCVEGQTPGHVIRRNHYWAEVTCGTGALRVWLEGEAR